MAITSESQILKSANVKMVANRIDTVIKNLKEASEHLKNSSSKCDKNVLETNEGNTFPKKLAIIQGNIDVEIENLDNFKNTIIKDAESIEANERASYNEYLKTKDSSSTSKGGGRK